MVEEQFGLHVGVDVRVLRDRRPRRRWCRGRSAEPGSWMRAPRGSTPAKSRRARLSLINTAPGGSSSSNQRPLTSDIPSSRGKFAEIELTGAPRASRSMSLDRLALLDHQHHRLAARSSGRPRARRAASAPAPAAPPRSRGGPARRGTAARGSPRASSASDRARSQADGVVICQTLLSIRPAPASSTTVRATCSATIARPASRTRRDADTLRPPSFRTSCTLVKHKRDRRPDAEEQRRRDRDRERDGHHAEIERRLAEPWHGRPDRN